MPHHRTAVIFYRSSAVEYLFGGKHVRLLHRASGIDNNRSAFNTTRRLPMEEAFLAAVKQAFHTANVCHDCDFKYTLHTRAVAALTVAQCIVEYESGNEYIRLDMLIDSFRGFGDIKLIEYRGRGSTDAIQLLFEFKFEGHPHQVIYILPQG